VSRRGFWMAGLVAGLAALFPDLAMAEPPQRIVSANQCSDVLLPALVEPARIAGLSRLAGDNLPAVPRISGSLDSILALQPDLVLIGPEGRGRKEELLRGFGLEVMVFDLPDGLDALRELLRRMGARLDAVEQAEALADGLPLAGPVDADAPQALWLAPNLYAFGAGTMAGDLLAASGWRNGLGTDARGWVSLTLEGLLARPVALLITGGAEGASRAEGLLAHPALDKVGHSRLVLPSEGLGCDPAAVMRVAELLRTARRGIAATGGAG